GSWDAHIIFLYARMYFCRFVVPCCAAKTSPSVIFPSPRPPSPTVFPYTTLFRSAIASPHCSRASRWTASIAREALFTIGCRPARSEEHTSELQSRFDLVCRLLLEKKKDCIRQ